MASTIKLDNIERIKYTLDIATIPSAGKATRYTRATRYESYCLCDSNKNIVSCER